MPQVFSNRNLKHRSFVGQNLTGINFSGADIRGADFSDACLANTNFSNVNAGSPPLLNLCLLVFSLFLALLSGLNAAYAGAVLGHFFATPETDSAIIGIFVTILLILFGFAALRNGLGFALGSISLIVATVIVFTVAITPSTSLAGKTSISSLALGGFIAGIVGLAAAINLNNLTKLNLAIALFGILCGGFVGIDTEKVAEVRAGVVGVVLVGTSVLILATYIGQKSLTEDVRYRLIHNLSIALTTFGGTRFCNANLTDANFTEATLHGTDFRGACLTRVRWLHAQLERANLNRTSLENPHVRHLLIDPTHNGVGKNLDRLNLQGANLQDANLADASLISTNLSNANLQGADLSRAKLVQAQLYGANLAGAKLTGVTIQNWGISPDTNLNGVQCDYIFMRQETPQNPDRYRKPDNWKETFREGEFVSFIAPIIRTLDSYRQQNLDFHAPTVLPKTLDLLHRNGIDPGAAAIALRQLIEQYPEADIEMLSIEGQGNQNIRIQARVASIADTNLLNNDYFKKYNKLKALSYPDLQQLLSSFEEKDAKLRSLESMITSALGSNKFYIEATPDKTLPPKTILILAANPRGTTHLRLDEEVREIQRDIERGKFRDRFILQQRWAVQTQDIRRALLDYEPQILHFSGHGAGTETPKDPSHSDRDISLSPESTQEAEGLIFEDDTGQPKLVSIEALSSLFQLFADRIECVVLNACYSEEQARAISQHIPYVIGMKRAIGDRAAIEFAIGFYDGILAGKSIEFSYKLGCSAIQTAGFPEHLTPVLKPKTP